jgi:hypothetical protein
MSRRIRSLALLALAAPAALAGAHRARAQARPLAAPTSADTSIGVKVDTLAEYVGWYRWGFEHSEFVACGVARGDAPWWVVPTGVAVRQRDSLAATVAPGSTGPVFVRVRGIVGAPVPVGAGHLGGSTRYFRVQEVLSMQKADGASCPVRA